MDNEVDDRRTTRVVVGSSRTVPAVWRRAGEKKGEFEGRRRREKIELSRRSFAQEEHRMWIALNLDEKRFFKEYDGHHGSLRESNTNMAFICLLVN